MASDNDTARAGLLALLDLVDVGEALAAVGSAELLSEVIVADAAGVDDEVGRQNVLCVCVRTETRSLYRTDRLTAAPRAAFWL